MRKFITTNTGKHRLRLGDLGFIDSKINEVADALANLCGDCILSGCEISSGAGGQTTMQITSGWVILVGELCYCPGGDTEIPNGDTNPTDKMWGIVSTVVNPSPVTYQDGVVHDVHFTRTAMVKLGNPGYVTYSATPFYWYAVKGAWVNITALGIDFGTGGSTPFRVRIDLMGRVSLSGRVSYNATWAPGSQDITTLASPYRPSQRQRFPLIVSDVYNGTLVIETTGVVTAILESGMPSGQEIYFSGVNYFID